jgi:hypothetical protein
MTNKTTILAAALVLALPGPVLAQSVCVAPAAPAPIHGATATQEEVLAAVREAKAFIAQSELYQTCLAQELEDAKTRAAAENKPVDQNLARVMLDMTDQSQKLKEKVGAEANGAVDAYKKAHP